MMRLILLVTSIISLFWTSLAMAQDTRVGNVFVKGNQRTETTTVIALMGIKPGSEVSHDELNAAVAKLYDSGLFADVIIRLDGNALYVEVSENPIIGDIAFEGNKRLNNEDLAQEISLRPRSIYTRDAVQRDVRRVLELYRRNGRFSTIVEPKIIELDQNRINLVFEIDEGDRSEISRITFVGNDFFNDDVLASELQTKESRWYRFFSSDDNYDPDRLAFDEELLRRFYVNNGFADFRVLSTTAELTPDRTGFVITFTVEEGLRYTFGSSQIESQIEDVDVGALNELMESKPGELFRAKDMENTETAVTDALGDKGYAFVDIRKNLKRDQATQTIDVTYTIQEGPRVYVDNINIDGNLRTLDEVIRREFRLSEGDPYNSSKIKRTEQRIQNLGFFNDVKVKTERTDEPDKVDIQVDVQEQSTGELTFGAGFSTADGPLGDISVRERNLLGQGQDVKLSLTAAASRQQAEFSFTEPYFLDRNISAGFDLFTITRDGDSGQSNRTFDNDTTGINLRLTYPIIEHLTHTLRYSYQFDDIRNIDANASIFIREQEGENTTSLVGHSLFYDQRDNRFEPTEGYALRFNQDFAGLSGDAQFVRHEIRTSYYEPLYDRDYVLGLGLNAGHIFGWGGEDVRINDRFFLSSNDFRGFDNDGIGPRDEVTRDPLGGNTYAVASAEVRFPLGLPDEMGVSGAIFTDFGTLYGVDTLSSGNLVDEGSIRGSGGFGVAWKSPVGPIRLDFSHAFLKEDFDETQFLSVNFGTRF